jgi:hypothetical protein
MTAKALMSFVCISDAMEGGTTRDRLSRLNFHGEVYVSTMGAKLSYFFLDGLNVIHGQGTLHHHMQGENMGFSV